jgi:hypothetical protein
MSLEARVDVAHGIAAAELPVLGEIGRPDRISVVVLERRRGLPIGAPREAVALVALELLEHGLAFRDAVAARSLADRNRFRRRALERVGRECLEVLDDRSDLGRAQPRFPFRHRGARHPDLDDAAQVVVRGYLTAGSGSNLINCFREVARMRQHRLGADSIAGAGLAVTAGAPFVVDGFAVLGFNGAKRKGHYRQGQQRWRGRTQTTFTATFAELATSVISNRIQQKVLSVLVSARASVRRRHRF